MTIAIAPVTPREAAIMGKSSQRKGRAGELEIVRILIAAGWSAIVKKIYDALDIEWEGDDCEVKRRKEGMRWAYDAFANGAQAVFFRADHEQWLIIHTLDGYARKHGPELKTGEPIE
jgi:hypothetical protein